MFFQKFYDCGTDDRSVGEIRRFLRDDGSIKVSRGLKERSGRILAARTSLEQSLGREPRLTEIASATGFTVEEIAEADMAALPAESLQKETGEEGFTLEHILGDPSQEERMLESVALRSAIEELPEKEKQVVVLRYYRGLTQHDCARILSVSQVQISRLERKAVDRLREILV